MRLSFRSPSQWLSEQRKRHFHDYHDQAFALWSVNFLAGCAALAWALYSVTSDAHGFSLVVCGMTLAVVASRFPLNLPRVTQAVSLGDVIIFGALATLGIPAACLVAVVDSACTVMRTSTRVSSRLLSPTIAAFAMVIAGGFYDLTVHAGAALQLRPEPVFIAALSIAAIVNYLLTGGLFMHLISVKRDLPFVAQDWLGSTSWMGALQVGSAVAVGLALLITQIFGVVTLIVLLGVVVTMAALIRTSIMRNEAERVENEAQIAEARREAEVNYQRFMASFTHAAVGMAITQPGGTTLRVNQSVCQLLRRDEDNLVGARFEDFFVAEDLAPHREALREVLTSRVAAVTMEIRLRDMLLETWVSVHCSSFDDPVDGGTCVIYQMHDITARRVAESRLAHIAYHDSLTDVANRAWFDKQLSEAVEACSLDGATRFAVVMIDLDRFKIVNDSMGHAAGNLLLVEVARRLRECVRPQDLVARLGGDEFGLLLREVTSMEEARRVSERMIERLAEPMRIMSTELVVRASVGITLSDLGYRTADEMTRDADLAMYEAKSAGRGRVAIYDSSMHQHIAGRMRLEADLAQAIQDGALTLVFQPLYQLNPYRLTGFEALCRWTHPERGPVPPSQFIHLAEESGLVALLTPWVIETAVRQLASWRRMAPHLSNLSVNVNVSGRDLALQNFALNVKTTLAEAGLPAANLTLEITETSLMQRMETALEVMQGLRQFGVRFAIDDFGTGYSSLAYLSSLPIDGLKIDQSFINGMDRGQHNVEIVRAVNRLGQALGKKVVAEGVETVEQLERLREMDIHTGQGYLLARPLRADQVPELLFAPATEPGVPAA